MTHHLKCWPEFFQVSWVGAKSFEIRKDDRNFKIYDEIILEEYDPKEKEFTGRTLKGTILFLTSFEQKQEYVVFSCQYTGRSE